MLRVYFAVLHIGRNIPEKENSMEIHHDSIAQKEIIKNKYAQILPLQ